MVSHINKLYPMSALLTVARERGASCWTRLSALLRRAFPMLCASMRVRTLALIASFHLGALRAIVVVMDHHHRAGMLEQARLRALSLALSLAAKSEGDLLNYNFIKLEQTAEKVTAD